MRKSTYYSLIGLLFIAITVWTLALQKPDNKLHINFLDIGQGDSIYIRTPSGADILVDGGPNNKVLSQLSQVMPLNDREIELVIATHNDSDHVGGLIPVLNRYKVDEIWINGATHTTHTYFNLMKAIKKQKDNGAKVKVVVRGQEDNWGLVHLIALAPVTSFKGIDPQTQNDATIVARLDYKKFKLLLTGDMETSLEDQLIPDQTGDFSLKSTVLKVGHHGSAGSTSPEFLKAVDPDIAAISVGYHNRYGHPKKRVIDLLKSQHIPTFRTDQQGRIEVVSDGANYTVSTQK